MTKFSHGTPIFKIKLSNHRGSSSNFQQVAKTGSGQAILAIQAAHGGYENLYNLKGGILAWAKEIDTSLPTY